MNGPIIPDGYILYARAVLESRLWMCGPDTLRVATWLLLQARSNRKPKKFFGFDQKRGEVVTSYGSIAEGTEWFENRTTRKYSRQKVSRIVKQLVEIGFCEVISDTYGTHLSVCKYDTYQNPNNYKADMRETTMEQHRDNTETTPDTNNNVNNDNNDNNVKNTTNSSQAVKNDKHFSPTIEQEKESLLSIPLNVRGTEYYIYQSDVDEWQDTFQAVDVVSQIKLCRLWSIDNPTKRKTKSGIRRHITSWLSRAQDKGGNNNRRSTYNQPSLYQEGGDPKENLRALGVY